MARRTLMALLAATSVAVLAAAQPPAQISAIRLGLLVDGRGHSIRDAVVVLDGDRITRVGHGNGAVPKGATVLDLRKYSGIPGLIDLHTHITYYWDPDSGTLPLRQPAREPNVTAELAFANAKRTLEAGVTTIRDLGASRGIDYLMRDAVNAGNKIGPRMFVAGAGIQGARVTATGPAGGPGTDAMRQQAEARVKAGSDWVKLYASTGSFQNVTTTQTLTYEEMKAAVDAAHALGKPVAIHSYGASGVKDAVRAGADSVEHGIDIDDETFADMAKRGTVWVPTIDHNRYYIDARGEYGWTDDVVGPLHDYIDKNFEATKRAVKAHVKIGMGSDAVYSMFGQNTRELAWMVKAGMTPARSEEHTSE